MNRKNHIIPFLILTLAFFAVVSTAQATATPTSFTNLKLWLDASQGATTDGTTSATDGETVQQWNDSSGNSNNATQGTSGSRPTYKTNIFNSNPVLRFDGGDTIVTSSFLDSTFNTAFTFFIVANKVDTTLQVHTSNQGVTWYSGRTTTPLMNTNGLDETSISAGTDQALTGTAVELFRYDGSSKFARYQITPDNYFTRESATGNLGLSGGLTVGALSSGAFGYVGDIAEVIAYNRALTGFEMSQVETYLLKKYVNASHASTTNLPQIIFEGDSLTEGVGATGGETYPKQTIDLLGGTSVFRYYNQGVSSQTTQQMIDDGVSQIDPLYSSFKSDNIVVLWGGTNDLYFGASAATTYSRIVEYATARRAAGYKVAVATILPRSGGDTPGTFETDRQTVNTSIRTNWATFADAIVDVAANTDIGEDNDEQNTTYYPDGVHLNNTGYAIVADLVRDQVEALTADTTAPTILNISSNKANATYGAGEVIDIDVTFSEAVTSTGNVTVTLETGTTDRTCTFTVTSDTTGTCNYTVVSGDTSADLTVSSVSGTIKDASLNTMVSFTPTTNLAANKALVISTDATAPTITSVSSDKTNGSYTTGEVIDIDVTFSEAVTSTGNVTVTLETGATDRTCTFTISSSTTGTCNYTVQAGDTSADLTVSSISGTIADGASNAMSNFVPTTNLAANKALVIDTTAPTITNVSSDKTNGSYTAGEVIDIDVTFSEVVTSTGNVTVTLETGTTDRTCTFTVTSDTTGTCNYTVVSGDTTSDLTVSSISGTINDVALNAMASFTPATNLAANKALVIDTTAPAITSVTVTTGITTATLTWTTDESASTKANYGFTNALGAETTETDTSPRVTSHSVTITNLSRCTVYHFSVTSKDSSENSATSRTDSRTQGCSSGGGGFSFTPTQPVSVPTTPNTPTAPTIKPYTNIPVNFKFVLSMRYGQSSKEIAHLQEFLKQQDSSIYPEGLVTGYFGPMTKRAVERFQELHADTVLYPIGLKKGTGFVGALTKIKINAMLEAGR